MSSFRKGAMSAMWGFLLSCPAPMVLSQVQPPPVPAVHKNIYPSLSAAETDVQHALLRARKEHKRVLMIFGGNWCGDCQVLDINLHDPENSALLEKYFVVVHVNVGHMDQNIDLAERYGVPPSHGVPAMSVVDDHGNVLHAQASGEFRNMRNMDPASVKQFLEQWKA